MLNRLTLARPAAAPTATLTLDASIAGHTASLTVLVLHATFWRQVHPSLNQTARFHQFYRQGWGTQSYWIRDVDAASQTVLLGDGGWQIGDSTGFLPYNPFFVDGILEEMTAPLEWHVDPLTRTLRFYPNRTRGGGGATPPLDTVAALHDSVFVMQGTVAQPVRFVVIKGLRITATARLVSAPLSRFVDRHFLRVAPGMRSRSNPEEMYTCTTRDVHVPCGREIGVVSICAACTLNAQPRARYR